jgi:hypothetical protein
VCQCPPSPPLPIYITLTPNDLYVCTSISTLSLSIRAELDAARQQLAEKTTLLTRFVRLSTLSLSLFHHMYECVCHGGCNVRCCASFCPLLLFLCVVLRGYMRLNVPYTLFSMHVCVCLYYRACLSLSHIQNPSPPPRPNWNRLKEEADRAEQLAATKAAQVAGLEKSVQVTLTCLCLFVC